MTVMYVVTCLSHEAFCLCTVLPQSVIYKAAISISRLKNFSLCRFFKFVDMSRFFFLICYIIKRFHILMVLKMREKYFQYLLKKYIIIWRLLSSFELKKRK